MKQFLKNSHFSKGFFGLLIFIICFSPLSSYAANSSTILPISRGGTNSSTANGAATNILGANFANYTGALPIAKGGTGASDIMTAQKNLNFPETIQYSVQEAANKYVKIAMIPNLPSSLANVSAVYQISGLANDSGFSVTAYLYGNSRKGTNLFFMTDQCQIQNLYNLYYVNVGNVRNYYASPVPKPTSVTIWRLSTSAYEPKVLTKDLLDTLPSDAVQISNSQIFCLTS
ncbi:MAG: hypothetical protein LBT85_02030 [Bifidobacteriaceae bacterium]|jgi:hypothetical protein|nr:hypothetical protein [Bifidobacteriaceae bacterium]